MAKSLLFGYTIEDDDGKLVVTVNGVFAKEALQNLHAQLKSGRAFVLSRLLPTGTLGRLLSRRIDLVAPPEGKESEGESLDMDQIFGQGVDRNFASFEEQMNKFRGSLQGREERPKRITKLNSKRAIRRKTRPARKKLGVAPVTAG